MYPLIVTGVEFSKKIIFQVLPKILICLVFRQRVFRGFPKKNYLCYCRDDDGDNGGGGGRRRRSHFRPSFMSSETEMFHYSVTYVISQQ
jgi:hypothetical protein